MNNQIKLKFRENKSINNAEEIKRLLNGGKEEYKSLYEIYSKKYQKEYPLSDIRFPKVLDHSKKLLSTHAQTKSLRKKKGIFGRLMDLMKPTKNPLS